MDVKKFKRFLFFSFGLLLLGFGITLTIRANTVFGIGAWDAINVALNRIFPSISIGSFLFIISIINTFIAASLFAHFPKITSLIVAIIIGITIDIALLIIPITINPYLSFGLGLCLIAIGTIIYLETNFLMSPIDYLMKSIMFRFNVSIGVAKIISETAALIIALLLSAPISYGTIIIIVVLGPLMQLIHPFIANIINKTLNG